MKILHINSNYIYNALHQELIEMLNEYSENCIFVPIFKGARKRVNITTNAVIIESFHKWDRLAFRYKQNKIISMAEQNINLQDIDLFHAYTLFTDGNCARELSKKYKKPYVVAVRNTDVNLFFKKIVYLRKLGIEILRDAAAVFFLSEVYKTEVIENYVPYEYREKISSKSYVIPNGINSFFLNNISSKTNVPSEKIRLIYIGEINRNKNIDETIQAIDILKKRGYDITFSIVGSITDKKYIRIIEKKDFIQYWGKCQHHEVINYLRQADIFVMPSHAETFGLVYAEAMSQGLPVIYTKGQGFDGQFADGEVGYSVSDKDAYELADKVENIIGNYLEISKNCSHLVKKFDWTIIAKRYNKIYSRILNIGQ